MHCKGSINDFRCNLVSFLGNGLRWRLVSWWFMAARAEDQLAMALCQPGRCWGPRCLSIAGTSVKAQGTAAAVGWAAHHVKVAVGCRSKVGMTACVRDVATCNFWPDCGPWR